MNDDFLRAIVFILVVLAVISLLSWVVLGSIFSTLGGSASPVVIGGYVAMLFPIIMIGVFVLALCLSRRGGD